MDSNLKKYIFRGVGKCTDQPQAEYILYTTEAEGLTFEAENDEEAKEFAAGMQQKLDERFLRLYMDIHEVNEEKARQSKNFLSVPQLVKALCRVSEANGQEVETPLTLNEE